MVYRFIFFGFIFLLIATACGGGGSTAPARVPTIPQNLAAEKGDTEVTLTWDEVTGVTIYKIYIASEPNVSPSNYSQLADGDSQTPATSPYLYKGLTNRKTYYFTVTALNGDLESGNSNEAMVIPVSPAPQNFLAMDGDTDVTLSWEDVNAATSYNLYMATEPGLTIYNYAGLANGEKIEDPTNPFPKGMLTTGTIYYFIVTAVTATDESDKSNEVSVRPSLSPYQLTMDSGNNRAPVWSPDGMKIVFDSDRSEPISGNRDIWVMDKHGGNQTPLTAMAGNNERPHFNHDGTKIVFISDRAGTKDVWVMDVNGANPENITNSMGDDELDASFNSDGTQIVYESMPIGGNSDIWIIDSDGLVGSKDQLTSSDGTVNSSRPHFAPSGSQIVFESDKTTDDEVDNTEIWVMSAVAGSAPILLSQFPDINDITNIDDNKGHPHYSADSKKIVYWLGPDDSKDVRIMESSGANSNPITTHPADDAGAFFSHDGSRFAFHSNRDDASGNYNIWVYRFPPPEPEP